MTKVNVLRTCNGDGTSHGGFRWPTSGPVEAPDWDPSPCCGGGLHGLLNGQGDGYLLDWSPDAIWQVVRVCEEDLVELSGKVKFPRGEVIYSGDHQTATSEEYFPGPGVHGATRSAGYRGTATTGYYGTATTGDDGAATAGDYGTATVGDEGTATAGHYGTATAGNWGTATAGNWGTATAGHYGTATVGNGGAATTGYYGAATAGDYGTATTGDYGTATAGYKGTASAGSNGTIIIKYYEGNRERFVVGYIGEDGLLPDTPYRLNKEHQFEVAR